MLLLQSVCQLLQVYQWHSRGPAASGQARSTCVSVAANRRPQDSVGEPVQTAVTRKGGADRRWRVLCQQCLLASVQHLQHPAWGWMPPAFNDAAAGRGGGGVAEQLIKSTDPAAYTMPAPKGTRTIATMLELVQRETRANGPGWGGRASELCRQCIGAWLECPILPATNKHPTCEKKKEKRKKKPHL